MHLMPRYRHYLCHLIAIHHPCYLHVILPSASINIIVVWFCYLDVVLPVPDIDNLVVLSSNLEKRREGLDMDI